MRVWFRRKRLLIPAVLFAGWLLAWYALPFAVSLPEKLFESPASPVLLDRHGKVIRHLTADDFARCQPQALADMPRDLIDCTLAAEDKRFYQHGGIDVLAICRSARDCAKAGEVVSGASTITQQLIKISSPKRERNLSTKLHEALAARRLEMTWSKDQILTAYLNRVSYGNRRTGCAEAARGLFQKPLSDLSLGECALLAGVPQAPSRLNPLRFPQRALERRKVVLERLMALQPQSRERAMAAMQEPLMMQPLPTPTILAPWLDVRFNQAGASIATTLDLDLQREVEGIVSDELAKLRSANVQHAAVVVIHNPTRQILALVSSGNWHDPRGGQINGALAPRSPGSTLKPFTWLLAIERRGRFPGSMVADVPTRFRTEQGLDLPRNYDRCYRGPVSLRRSLACSLNVPAMRELNELGGPQVLHELLEHCGLTSLGAVDGCGLGLTIGNAPARLVELTNAYATLASGGVHAPCAFLPGAPPQTTRLFSESSAYLIADVLADPAARAPSFAPGGPLDLPFRCAVKTGTSSDFRDNWCIGFTKDFSVGVWAGNFDNTPMKGISGITGAGPMFHRTMKRAQRDVAPAWLAQPADLLEITLDARSGKRVNKESSGAVRELCPADRLPPFASGSDYDAEGRVLLDQTYQEWFASADNQRRNELALASDRPADGALRILAPSPDSTFLLDPELPNRGQRLRLSTNLPGTAEWTSATLQIVAGTPEPSAILVPGTHQLTVADPRTGQRQQVTIHVRSL